MTKRRDQYNPIFTPADVSRMCLQKGYFGTRNKARDHAARNKTGLNPYKCMHCDGWHLTHHDPGAQASIREAIRRRAPG